RDIQEKRLLRPPQKRAGLLGNQIRHISIAFDRLVVLIHHRLAAAAGLMMMEIVNVAAERSKRIIKTMLQRQEFWLIAQMPLPTNRRRIASLLQPPSQDAAIRRQPQSMLIGQPYRIVISADVANTDRAFQAANAMLISTRHQPRTSR